MQNLQSFAQSLLEVVKGEHPGLFVANSGSARERALRLIEEAKEIVAVHKSDLRTATDTTSDASSEETLVVRSATPQLAPLASMVPLGLSPSPASERVQAPAPVPAIAEEKLSKISDATLQAAVMLKLAGASEPMGKSAILEGFALRPFDAEWNLAIGELVDDGKLVRTGFKKGTKYHLPTSS